MNENNRLTKEQFLERNHEILNKYTIPIDNSIPYISGNLGNKDDLKKTNFQGIYVILENNQVIYIGSSLPENRTIEKRLNEHLGGHHTHSSIVPYLMKINNIDKEEAKKLLQTFDFMAFKYPSLEYLLIHNTPGIINNSGNKNVA